MTLLAVLFRTRAKICEVSASITLICEQIRSNAVMKGDLYDGCMLRHKYVVSQNLLAPQYETQQLFFSKVFQCEFDSLCAFLNPISNCFHLHLFLSHISVF